MSTPNCPPMSTPIDFISAQTQNGNSKTWVEIDLHTKTSILQKKIIKIDVVFVLKGKNRVCAASENRPPSWILMSKHP